MNTFIIYQESKTLLNFVCDNPPSLVNRYLILLLTLDNSKFQNLDYVIFTIVGDDKAYKFEDYNKTTDEFMIDFLKICDGSCKFGVKLYLK